MKAVAIISWDLDEDTVTPSDWHTAMSETLDAITMVAVEGLASNFTLALDEKAEAVLDVANS